VLAGLEREADVLRMQRGRRDHDDHVDGRIADDIRDLGYQGHPGAPGRELLAPFRGMGAHRPELREASCNESIELSEIGAEHVAGTEKTDDRALSFHDAELLQ
jgi:hypothetical protein